jgi:hypothetical protein
MPIMASRHLLYRWINSNVYRKSTDQLTTATQPRIFRGIYRFSADYHQKSSGKTPNT